MYLLSSDVCCCFVILVWRECLWLGVCVYCLRSLFVVT